MHPRNIQCGIDTLTQARGILPISTSTRWIGLCLALALALFLSVSVSAGAVSGRVYGPNNMPVKDTTFTATPARGQPVEFRTNSSGNFSVYLDSGRYTVTSSADATLQAVIDSVPQPVQQDIHLQRK
jgi:Carboxypeptidase regulatory-like domain